MYVERLKSSTDNDFLFLIRVFFFETPDRCINRYVDTIDSLICIDISDFIQNCNLNFSEIAILI